MTNLKKGLPNDDDVASTMNAAAYISDASDTDDDSADKNAKKKRDDDPPSNLKKDPPSNNVNNESHNYSTPSDEDDELKVAKTSIKATAELNTTDVTLNTTNTTIDNDGDNDIVVSNSGYGSSGTWDKSGGVGWYENNGAADPSFTRNNIIDYAYGANNVVVADLNGNGKLDIVSIWKGYPTGNGNSGLKKAVYRHINDGNSDPTFNSLAIRSSMPNLASVFSADMDGDGDIDIVTSQNTTNGSLSLFKNSGGAAPTFTHSNIPTNAEVSDFRNVYPGDINGDGHMDFVVSFYSSASQSYGIQLFENDGNSNPTWTYSTIATSTNFNKSLFIEDIDGDGDMDVIAASERDDDISWFENTNGGNNWRKSVIARTADRPRSIFAADMDGDGDVDVLAAARDKVAWHENRRNRQRAGRELRP